MTTTAKKNCKLTARQQRRFVAMLPAIQRYAGRRFRGKLGEERHELIAEVVALSFAMFVRLIERGKTDLAYPNACRQVAVGRRLGTPLNATSLSSLSGRERPQLCDRNRTCSSIKETTVDHHHSSHGPAGPGRIQPMLESCIARPLFTGHVLCR